MVKTVVAVIVGLVLLNTAWFVLKIAILIVAERREYEKYRYKSPYQSPHREAYIKMGAGPSVLYNREQLLCFLLAYDKAECLGFMEKLYHHMGWPTEKLHENPAFAEVIKEKEA